MSHAQIQLSTSVSQRDLSRLRLRRRLTRALLYSFLTLASLICMAPFFFMFSGSLMAEGEIFSLTPHFWPERPVYANYSVLFEQLPFARYMLNSVIVSVAQTAGVLFFTSLAGFVFAKRRFPGRDTLFLVALASALLPGGVMTIIPFYLMMARIGWLDTFWPLIVPWWAPAFSIFLMRQYIAAGVPDELLDAATIDGCGLFGAYWRVVLPLSVPGLVVVGITQFIAVWNDFLYGRLVLRSDELHTVTVALTALSQRTQAATLYGPLFAGIVLATLPTIILYLIFQRHLTEGILAGALRG